jgi:hypothetical protein
MKPHWSPRDLKEMLIKPLPFTQEDLMIIYSGLAMWGESTETPTVRDDPAVSLVSERQSAAALGSQIASLLDDFNAC